MKITEPLFVLCLFALAGCSTGTMSQHSYDASTGQSTHKVFSKYYDAGAWLSAKHLGMSVVVDHEKAYVPIVSGVQQSLGLLGPGDLSANGAVTIYLWNFDAEPRPVKIVRVAAFGEALTPEGKVITARPKGKTGAKVGDLKIPNYGTEIPITIRYELNGKQANIQLKLLRRTDKELKEYFGPSGRKPPYPWYQ